MAEITEDQRFEQIIHKIAPRSRLLRAWPLKGGISAWMTALEIERPDGQTGRMILRQPGDAALAHNPRAAEDEFRLLQIIHSLGLTTPRPFYLDQTGQILPTPFFVIEYIEGRPEFAPEDITNFSAQMAAHLAKIHQVSGANPDLAFLPRQTNDLTTLIVPRPAQMNQSLDEGRIRDTLQAAWPFPRPNPPVLLHGDYWPGNILWQDDRLAAVIDWEDAHLGDPLKDLAISRLDLLWIFGVEAMNSFTQAYQSRMAIDYTDLPYWDLYAALRLVRMAGADLTGWAAFFPPFGRADITEQKIREYYRYFVDQAFAGLQ